LSHEPPCNEPRPEPGDEGLVSIFTGDGKGKTTAAIGTAVRAAGHGFKVFIAFFAKGDRYCRGEAGFLAHVPGITITGGHHPNWILKDHIKEEDIQMAAATLAAAREAMLSGEYDLIVLDEINIAINFGLVSLEDVMDFIRAKPRPVELILTGRYAEPELIQMADLVTEMRMVKHPFSQGVRAHMGIDY
jgi:cob(I)alamin adenosyltransferase